MEVELIILEIIKKVGLNSGGLIHLHFLQRTVGVFVTFYSIGL